MIFLDTETCGLHGLVCLIQYARDNGEIQLYCPWKETITDTLKLIEEIANDDVVGFNLAFDWFHLNKLYNILVAYPDSSAYPEDIVEELALLESAARDGVCIKPKSACDLMLHARKGPYQSTMDRSDIRVRKVPTQLAWKLAEELTKRITFPDIYFARKGDPTERWKVYDIENDLGDVDPHFKDIVLKFAPSSALKALAMDALGMEQDILKFTDVDCNIPVNEVGWAPFASALGSKTDWKGTWPDVIIPHIGHWAYNDLAREYAKDDIVYTRNLYKYFSAIEYGFTQSEAREFANSETWFGSPVPALPMGDDDSILACMVGAVRWKGFKVNIPKLLAIREQAVKDVGETGSLATAPHIAKKYLLGFMNPIEQLTVQGGTKKQILEEVSKWQEGKHPAAIAAKRILDARKAKKKLEVIDKLLQAGRFHASFRVIGTLSSRMSGADGLNPQGISHDKMFRDCFDLAWDDMFLCGGDFESFEVTLADAEYKDPRLHEELKSGKKIHALLGELFFPDMTYEDIEESKGTEDDFYSRSKQGVFALIYGGDSNTLINRLNVGKDDAEEAYQEVIKRYPKIGEARKKVFDQFCSMRQPNGIGTKVEWHEPANYIESILGFRRYFTLENRVCRALFDLAEKPPEDWTKLQIKVVRRDRQQTASGAVRSALFGAAFAIQAGNMRAAANHRIQSTGAQITKRVERNSWELQPVGVSSWIILPMNIHDEIMNSVVPTHIDALNQIVKDTVESFRPIVPLIGIDWKNKMKSWASK